MRVSSKRIGQILIEKGLITESQLQDALKEQKNSGGFLGKILVSRGWIEKAALSRALAEQFAIPFVDLKKEHIDMELARQFSSSLILEHKCLPIRKDEESVIVAIIDPLDAVAISKIEAEAKPRKIKLVLVSEDDLNESIQNYRKQVSNNIQRLLKRDKNP